MCVAVVGFVTNVEGNTAKVDFNGAIMNVSIDFVHDVKVGEYLLVHAGFALEKIKKEEAVETMNTFKELQGIE